LIGLSNIESGRGVLLPGALNQVSGILKTLVNLAESYHMGCRGQMQNITTKYRLKIESSGAMESSSLLLELLLLSLNRGTSWDPNIVRVVIFDPDLYRSL